MDDARIPGLIREPDPSNTDRFLADPSETLCYCESVPASVVIALIRMGLHTREEITARCNAGGGCSSCHQDIEDLIERLAGESQPPG